MMKFYKKLFFAVTLLSLASLQAGVNLKNGNFYISYTDLILTGTGPKIEITRTYNSKSLDSGWFGNGWGSFFETKLVVSPEGSIVVHEHGAGGLTRFVPAKGKMNVAQSIKKIVAQIKKKTQMTAKAEKQLVKKLQNAEFRHAYAKNYGIVTKTKSGQKWISTERGSQNIVRKKNTYIRTVQSGRKDHFNLKGQLIKTVHSTGHTIDLKYSKSGLKSIKDNFAKEILFEWFPDGQVKAMWKSADNKATYKYKNGNLVESRDLGNNIYKYKYDKVHNLTQIAYKDKSKMEITYDPKTYFVTSITDRNKNKVEYEYGKNKKNPENHYWTYVTKKGFSGKKIKNKYEYETKSRKDGSRYTHRIFTSINGIETDTTYNECCGKPLKIRRGNVTTEFKYTKGGNLLEKKSSTGEFSKLTYDKKSGKVSKVVNNSGSVKYKYDKKGNLSQAVSSKGNAVALIYDSKARISKMIDKNQKTKKKKTMSFKYNAAGKPILIKLDKVGSINVDYDSNGNIKDVKSKAGQAMALEVTDSFQNLLGIVEPAGVDLSI